MNRTENGETIHATISRCFWRPLNLLSEFLMAIFGFSFQRINESINQSNADRDHNSICNTKIQGSHGN